MFDKLLNTIQDCNLSFLIGSGASAHFVPTLGTTELLLTQLEASAITDTQKRIVRATIYKKFFQGVIAPNVKIIDADPASQGVLATYKEFLRTLNSILLNRKSTILTKQANIFTTNIDVFMEIALEAISVDYSDGFLGRFNPTFDLSNFKTSHFKTSLHYDNMSEIPVFNVLKFHGSLSWVKQIDAIGFTRALNEIRAIEQLLPGTGVLPDYADDADLASIVAATAAVAETPGVVLFLNAYNKLLIVNPTKDKFRDTLLNQTYYDLLRLFSNDLEKENSALFVVGFSFADEHIRDLVIRAANSNPTLLITVYAYTDDEATNIKARLKTTTLRNKNIEVIAPADIKVGRPDLEHVDVRLDIDTVTTEVLGRIVYKPMPAPGATPAV